MAYMYRVDETLSSTSPYYNNPDYDIAAALGSTQHYPYYANFTELEVKYSLAYGITQVPVPTINTPFLLNLTGADLQVSMDWKSTVQSDVAFLLTYFPTANPSVRIVIDLTGAWGGLSTTANTLVTEKYNSGNIIGTGGVLRFSGAINSFSVTERAGAVLWDYSLTMYVGLMEG